MAVIDDSEIQNEDGVFENMNRMRGLKSFIIKWLPTTSIWKEPEVIKDEVETLEMDGPHKIMSEQITCADLPLIFATDKNMGALKCDPSWSFVRVLLDDIHWVALSADAEIRLLAEASNVPKDEPDNTMILAPDDPKKLASENDANDGMLNDILDVKLSVNFEKEIITMWGRPDPLMDIAVKALDEIQRVPGDEELVTLIEHVWLNPAE